MSRTPAVAQVGHHRPPEPGALPGGAVPGRRLGHPDAQHVLLPVAVDPDGDVGGLVLHRVVVADLDHDRGWEHHRVDQVQRPGLPGPDLLQHRVSDPGDRLGRQLGAVDLLQVVDDVPHAHPVRVQADDHVVQAAGHPPGTFRDQQRLEAARPGPAARPAAPARSRSAPSWRCTRCGNSPIPARRSRACRSPGARPARPAGRARAPPRPAPRASTRPRSAAAPRPRPSTAPAARPAAGHPSAPAAVPAPPAAARRGRPRARIPAVINRFRRPRRRRSVTFPDPASPPDRRHLP